MTTTARYRLHLFACTNRRSSESQRPCCSSRNAEALLSHLKAKAKEQEITGVRINSAGCLGHCSKGPVLVVYPEGVWYTIKTLTDVEEILDQHLINNQPVERLLMAANEPGAT